MKEVPAVSMHSGKVQNDGGDHSAPGQVHPPPGAWPGAPAGPVTPPPGDWSAGEADDGIVTAPLPALRTLTARFSERLADTEWVAFCQATVNRGTSLGLDDQQRLLDREQRRIGRDAAVLAALEGFCAGMADAVIGNSGEKKEEAT